jgi:hypothetical protein
VLLYLVGGGLIHVFNCRAALVSGLLCLTAGLASMILVEVILAGIDWLVRKANAG